MLLVCCPLALRPRMWRFRVFAWVLMVLYDTGFVRFVLF
jgi:hypothetical protein